MIQFQKHDNVLKILLRESKYLDTACGGYGRCGKCRFQIIEGFLPIHEAEEKLLTPEQLAQGVRLACEHQDCEVDCIGEVFNKQEHMQILGLENMQLQNGNDDGCAIALDIGTTTVVMVLLDIQTGSVLLERSFLNPQRRYGSDVISRIQRAHELGVKQLQKVLLQEISIQLKAIHRKDIRRMCICGNAVMTHLFLGIDPISLASAPYECIQKELSVCSSKQFFANLPYDFEIQILPPISAYVGSDIVMGIYSLDMMESEKSLLLLDLGTNGELALYHEGKLTLSSAACGPAFEGGNMSCGSGAVAGAISEVYWHDGIQTRTIHNQKPIAICGSGYLSLISCLLTQSMLDVSGYLASDVILAANLLITQKDVREFQLAKAAIAASLERVCVMGKCTYEQIHTLYLSGGFGSHLHVEDLCLIGILPQSLKEKVRISGNTALKGCCKYALQQDQNYIKRICENSNSILLAKDHGFNDAFVKHMMLEPYE